MRYADDTVLSAGTYEDLQRLINKKCGLGTWHKQNKIYFNDKSNSGQS